MPTRPPRVCPKCKRTTTARRCPCTPAWAGSRNPGTSSYRWKKLRDIRLTNEPLCRSCGRPATVVDHIIPYAERPDLHLDYDNTQSLCQPCHNAKTGQDAARAKHRPRESRLGPAASDQPPDVLWDME